jgi:hypothetical protein
MTNNTVKKVCTTYTSNISFHYSKFTTTEAIVQVSQNANLRKK